MNSKELYKVYLKQLSISYPNIQSVATEIINLQAILNLPKGTEHFISDLHGENEAFLHILKNASGVIREKIDMMFGDTLSESERRNLAILVYYPKERLAYLKKQQKLDIDWYKTTLYRLVELCRIVSSKYTRSKVRKALPKNFCYIIDELLHTESTGNKHEYYWQIIESIITIDRADTFIIELSNAIQNLSIDHLHIVGDIYDRGPRADLIIDQLTNYHSLDIQWGNHDIEWIGAATGIEACIANVVRNSIKYGNIDILEEGYGISLRSLSDFAVREYSDDSCKVFNIISDNLSRTNKANLQKMYKAISIIQFKLEGQIINRHKEYDMDSMKLLDKIKDNYVTISCKNYKLKDCNFPTVNCDNPFMLTDEESSVILKLKTLFLHSEKLQKHIRFILSKGNIYTIYNDNLLYHGCVPLNCDGNLQTVNFFGSDISGKQLFDESQKIVRNCYYNRDNSDSSKDFIWYLWCGKYSPLYGKNKMATFEKLFIDDSSLCVEEKNYYYVYNNSEKHVNMILNEFGIKSREAHIINGHMPVKTTKGELPIKANGKLFIIDGGLSKEYHKITGIAGYTLIYNSYGYRLVKHTPFSSAAEVVENNFELHSTIKSIEEKKKRKTVKYTDVGKEMLKQIYMLQQLLNAYKSGELKEKI